MGLEAPSGAGKTTTLDELGLAYDGPVVRLVLSGAEAGRAQLHAKLRRSLRHRGLSDLAAALDAALEGSERPDLATVLPPVDREAPLLVVIDEMHLADDEATQSLLDLVERWPDPHRLVLAGRRLPGELTRTIVAAGGMIVGPGDLRFSEDETRELLGDAVASRLEPTEIALLTQRCDGWAGAIALAAARLQRTADAPDLLARELARLLTRPVTLTDLLASILDDAPEHVHRAAAQLARLVGFDDEIARRAGLDGGLPDLADLGLALEPSIPGLVSFPNAVRAVLAAAEADGPVTRFAARRYLDLGHHEAALEVLAVPGFAPDLVALLLELSPDQRSHLDTADHARLVAAIPEPLLAASPQLLVHLGDSFTLSGRIEEYRNTIRRARALVGADPGPEALEVVAADLTMRTVASDGDALAGDAEALLGRADLPPMARARLLGALGRASTSKRTTASLRLGGQQLEEAARLFQHEGATVHATAVRVITAVFSAWPLGHYQMALDQLEQALASFRDSVRLRVAALPYRAFVLIDLGRYTEAQTDLAELRHAATAGGRLSNERSAAFARWGAARMTSQQGDAEATWAACHAVEASDVVVDTGHGAFFRADAAQLLARVGEHDEAERLLAEARRRDPGTTERVTVAEFVVAARAGDLDRAETMLQRLDGGRAVEPRDRWRVTLLHAHVRRLVGAPGVGALAAAAFEGAAQLGFPQLPMIREPDVARALLPLAAERSASARDALLIRRARLRVLSVFELEIDGRTVEPSGRPGELLAFLALHGSRSTVEQAVEALWPDTDPGRGRERLRTVLRRVRKEYGDLIERHEDSLRLGPGVEVDVEEFLGFVQQTRPPGPGRIPAATAAIAVYAGGGPPALAYQPWAIEARGELDRHALAMLDLLASEAEKDRRLDEAIRTYRTAIAADPIEERRYLAVARLLAEQGRRSQALRVLDEATEAARAEGLEPSVELGRFEAYLRRNPVTLTAAS